MTHAADLEFVFVGGHKKNITRFFSGWVETVLDTGSLEHEIKTERCIILKQIYLSKDV